MTQIPDDVYESAEYVLVGDRPIGLDAALEKVAEWARKEALREALALAVPVDSTAGIRIRAVPDVELVRLMESD